VSSRCFQADVVKENEETILLAYNIISSIFFFNTLVHMSHGLEILQL